MVSVIVTPPDAVSGEIKRARLTGHGYKRRIPLHAVVAVYGLRQQIPTLPAVR